MNDRTDPFLYPLSNNLVFKESFACIPSPMHVSKQTGIEIVIVVKPQQDLSFFRSQLSPVFPHREDVCPRYRMRPAMLRTIDSPARLLVIYPPVLASTDRAHKSEPIRRLSEILEPLGVFQTRCAIHIDERPRGRIVSSTLAIIFNRIRRQWPAFLPLVFEPSTDGVQVTRLEDGLLVPLEPSSREVCASDPGDFPLPFPKNVNLGVKQATAARNETQLPDFIQCFQGIGLRRVSVCADDGTNRHSMLPSGVIQATQRPSRSRPRDSHIDVAGVLEIFSELRLKVPNQRHLPIS